MSVQIFRRKNNPVRLSRLKRCMEALLVYSRRSQAHLEISLVGSKKMAQLNKTYLKKDGVTDVLTFPMDENPPFSKSPWHLGEIVIATEVAMRQAKRERRSLDQQVLRLAVHGLVHLHTMDHEKGIQEKKDFEALEMKYLKHLQRKGLLQWDGLLRL